MERAMLLALLAQAEQHIALGKERINNRIGSSPASKTTVTTSTRQSSC